MLLLHYSVTMADVTLLVCGGYNNVFLLHYSVTMADVTMLVCGGYNNVIITLQCHYGRCHNVGVW